MDDSRTQPGVITRAVTTIGQMIAEGHQADAVVFLFYMHKTHIQEWVLVKRALLAIANDSRSLQTIASLLEASKKNSLSESARIIPGLSGIPEKNQSKSLN
jgi:hypothetical protein